MAPVQKTYAGYVPKRRGIPKFVLKESLETKGLFSALCIDNLKVIKGTAPKNYKSEKRKKVTEVREYKPTLDVTLDSTFDKIIKSTNSEVRTQNTPGKCLTCGCVPIDLAHHALYECKDDIFFLTPEAKSVKHSKRRKERSVKMKDRKTRKKRLALQPSSVTSIPGKPKAEIAGTPSKSNVEKLEMLIGVTSTPKLQFQRLTFGLQTSPISLFDNKERRMKDNDPLDNDQHGDESVGYLAADVKKLGPLVDTTNRPDLQTSPVSHLGDEQRQIQDSDLSHSGQCGAESKGSEAITQEKVDSCFIPVPKTSIPVDVEQKSAYICRNSTKESSANDTSSNGNNSIIECSQVMLGPAQTRPSCGYITKRRRWRRIRNVSADMFSSSDKFQSHSELHGSSRTPEDDRLQVSVSSNDRCPSVHSNKLDSEHHDNSCKNIHDCSNANVKERSSDSVITTDHLNELSIEFCRSVNFQCEQVEDKLRQKSMDRSADVFSGLSLGSQKICAEDSAINPTEKFQEALSNSYAVIIDNSVHMNLTGQKHSLLENSIKLPLSNSVVDDSRPNSVIFTNCSLESPTDLVWKPCYVRLYRCDEGTVADLTFASQNDMSAYEEDFDQIHNSVVSPNSDEVSPKCVNSRPESQIDKHAVVTMPLDMLGKVDKVCFDKSRLTLALSFHNVTPPTIGKDTETSHRLSVLDQVNHTEDVFREVLSRCGQTEPLPFEACYPKSMQSNCRKIGEGAYGEVFLHNNNKTSTVIKIIPVEGDAEVNGAVQKKFWEIRPEIVVAQELSTLRKAGAEMNKTDVFNEVLAVRCVRGRYPKWMLELWHKYDTEEGSENDCPDVFEDDQLYIVLELANGGRDLESYTFSSADQAVSAVAQIVFALAVGESAIEFEHRDLHWGNVLVAPHEAKEIFFTLEGTKYKIASKGVKVSVIDFTMSRMTMPSTGENMFYDFGADEDLFAAQGDYQCDIYRLMRERTKNNWSLFEPFTNILWLHYVLDKMCTMIAYRSRSSKLHQEGMRRLKKMRDAVLAYPSATAFAQSDFFKSTRCR